MKLVIVNDRKSKKEFLDFARFLYKGDNNWVCPLDDDIETIFDRDKNLRFKTGDAIRWILKNDKNETIGRIAAFYREEQKEKYSVPTGGIGFFECIDDKDAAFLLFDEAKKWLKEKGYEAMFGPVNFGENDSFWGLLVEGFACPGYGMTYNKPYYKKLFEEYGFKPYYSQVTNHLAVKNRLNERFVKIAKWVLNKDGYSFKCYSKKEEDKLAGDFVEIFNKAWQFHEDFTPLKKKNILKRFRNIRRIIVPEFIWFAYVNDEPAALFVAIPDINQILQKLNGKLHFVNKLRFLYYYRRKTIDRVRIVVFGVVPEYQKKGLESAIFYKLQQALDKPGNSHYKEIEISWVGDFNPKMQAVLKSLGVTFGKRHVTYVYAFDENTDLKRRSKIPMDTREMLK